MSSSLLIPVLITLALVYVLEGRFFEGVLLIVVGLTVGFYTEYLMERYFDRYISRKLRICPYCGSKMKNVAGLYYCNECRRFQEPRRARWGMEARDDVRDDMD